MCNWYKPIKDNNPQIALITCLILLSFYYAIEIPEYLNKNVRDGLSFSFYHVLFDMALVPILIWNFLRGSDTIASFIIFVCINIVGLSGGAPDYKPIFGLLVCLISILYLWKK
jgi:hypothetical protein